MPTGAQTGIGYTDRSNPDYDRGHCDADRTHLANFYGWNPDATVRSPALRALASDWRVSGILNARSGNTTTTGDQRIMQFGIKYGF